jgi:hypothetical protein
MTIRTKQIGVACVAIFAALLYHRANGHTTGSMLPAGESGGPAWQPLGMASCAASACHGNPNAPSLTAAPDRNCWQSSLTHFLAVDPHRKAFHVLHNEQSKQITAALRKRSSVSIPDAPNDPRCLACHTNPSLALPDAEKTLRSEGVGCEACHGNAASWRGVHTSWTAASRKNGIAVTTFRDLNSFKVRADTCAGCHVGTPAGNAGFPAGDMNHDMIAAGHPALPDDLTALMNRLPRHWHERDRAKADQPERKPDEGLTAIFGRAKEDALKALSQDRKTRTDGRTPWPELSETKCVDCHRKIPS